MEEFFMEADKYEKKYVKSARVTPFEIAKESNRHALACAIEFTQAFPEKRDVLLKDEIRSIMTSLRASKNKKSKKRKFRSRKRKSKRKKSKKKSKKRYK